VIYDLIVVGNGLAAQTFLFELLKSRDVKQSQNFSIAQIYSEEIAASCSLRSTATVCLSGIEDDVSDLGNELRDSYYLFEDFQKNYLPAGVEKVSRFVTFTNENDKRKMIRRYKNLVGITHPVFKEQMEGVCVDSYLVYPEVLNSWFTHQLSNRGITVIKNFLKNLYKCDDGTIECKLQNNEILKAKKIVLCTGAYAKIFADFFDHGDHLKDTHVVAGSYLQRSVDLNRASFYLTIDGHSLIYRSEENKLILGSASKNGGFVLSDHGLLNEILKIFNNLCSFSLGSLNDFKAITGMRHKGGRRRPIARAIDEDKNIYMISGLYKNGYTFSHLCAKKVLSEINLK
jgi:hypothetical protein